MSAIDFAKFKKINQDKKSATLVHPDGHEIKISIANLSPVLKKKLEELPLHQAKGSKEPVKELDDESPATVEDTVDDIPAEVEKEIAKEPQAQPAQAPAPQAQQPAQQQPAPEPQAAPQPQAQAPAPQPAPQAPAPEQAPQAPVQQAAPAPVPAAPPTPEQMAAEKTRQNMLVGEDMNNDHIKPKSYSDLFAEKSTLGKIGTIFGLILSGAGSGLTHQPNALLAMMDKQIQNDLEAQKTDQSNKQNWYKLSFEKLRGDAMNRLTNSEEFKNATEGERERMINEQMGVVHNEASVDALNHSRMAALHARQLDVNKMPQGSARDNAQNILNTMTAATQDQMFQDNLKVAQQKQQMGTSNQAAVKTNPPPTKGPAEPGVKYDVVDQKKLNEGFKKGLQFGQKASFIKGAIPQEAHAAINKEIEELTVNRNNLADAEDSFNKLAKMKNAGQVPGIGAAGSLGSTVGGLAGLFGGPVGAAAGAGLGHFVGALAGETAQHYFERNRAIQVEALKSRLGGNMSESDKQKLAESLLPAWSDKENSMAEAHRKMVQHFESNAAEAAPNLTQYGLKQPMPKYEFKIEKKKETK